MDKIELSDADFFSKYEDYLVSEVLKKCKENAKVKFSSLLFDKLPYEPDLYAPDGIPSLHMKGPTMIEVKVNLSFSSLKSIGYRFGLYKEKYNVLVVYFGSNLTAIPKDIEGDGHVCKYISYQELKGQKKDAEAKDKYYLKLSQKKDWKEERKAIIEEAKRIVWQGNCVLFFGAGVSMSAKMPSWSDLLKGLMSEVKQLKGDALDAFKELNSHVLEECGDSYLVMARYLQTAIKLYDDKLDFSLLIQRHLYNKEHSSLLLEVLATIVQQKKTDEVLTYNFDDILEQKLIEKGMLDGRDFITVSKDAEIKGHNMLPIYHVHGIIPETGPADIVVFSEEEYHKRYSNPFHWSNIEQLHAMSRKHCFFIGLSMTDPNLRRLLDTARQINKTDNECHYAFLRRQKLEKYCLASMADVCKYVHVSESLIDKKKQKNIYDLNYTVIECIFRELGVKVIWFEDFEEELPYLIEEVFGLNTKTQIETSELLKLVETKIAEMRTIENGLKKFNLSSQTSENVANLFAYSKENGEKYRNLTFEVGDMLKELSERVDTSEIVNLRKIQSNIPEYNTHISGYSELYLPWFNFVKKLLEK